MPTFTPPDAIRFDLPYDKLGDFCSKWGVERLSLFGSVLRDDFSPDSDLDFLVEIGPQTKLTLWDQMAMEEELAQLTGRSVDLVDRAAVEESRNWIRRREILSTAKEIYVAG